MEQTLIYKCPKCGNIVYLEWGCGFMWYKNDKSIFYPHKTEQYELNIHRYLLPRIRKEVYQFIESIGEPLIVDNVRWQPYICNKCGKIKSKIYFEILSPKIEIPTYKPEYNRRCHGKYKKISANKKHFYCHLCNTELIKYAEIMWD